MSNRNRNRNTTTFEGELVPLVGTLVLTGSLVSGSMQVKGNANNTIRGVDGAVIEVAGSGIVSVYLHDTYPKLLGCQFGIRPTISSSLDPLKIVNYGLGYCARNVFQSGAVPCVTASFAILTGSTNAILTPPSGTVVDCQIFVGDSSVVF